MLHCPRCSRPLAISDCSKNCCAPPPSPSNCQTKTTMSSGGIIQYPSTAVIQPQFHLYQNSSLGQSGGSCVTEMGGCDQTKKSESDTLHKNENLMRSSLKLQEEQRILNEQIMQLQITMLQKRLEESKLLHEMRGNIPVTNLTPNPQIILEPLQSVTVSNLPNYNHSVILSKCKKELVQSNWYFGGLDYQSSHALLASSSPGTFLLRDSQHPGCHFTLSFQRQEDGPTSIRIQLYGGKFFLDADDKIQSSMPRFDTVCQLVEHYLTEKEQPSLPLALKKPLYNQVPSLMHLSRISINRAALQNKNSSKVDFGPVLPQKLIEFLKQYPLSI